MKAGIVRSSSLGGRNPSVLQAHKVWVVRPAPPAWIAEPQLLWTFKSPPRYMPKKPSARAVFIRQSVLEAEAREEVSSVLSSLPAFPSPTHTYIPLYTSFPCWFCSRVLARSIGNTQVTPTRPATPPLMSFAVMLGHHGEEKRRQSERRSSAALPPQLPPRVAVRPAPPSAQAPHLSPGSPACRPDPLRLTHSEGSTKLRYCRPAGKPARRALAGLSLAVKDALQNGLALQPLTPGGL